MRLHRLELRQFRRFGHLELEFAPELTVLAGPTNSGKTSVLEGIVLALGSFVGAFPMGRAHLVRPSDACVTQTSTESEREEPRRSVDTNEYGTNCEEVRERDGHSHERSGASELVAHYPVVIRVEMNEPNLTSEQELRGPKARPTRAAARALADYAKALQTAALEGTNVTFPVVAYYSANRFWAQARDPSSKRVGVELERSAGYENSLRGDLSFIRMSNWVKSATLYVL